MNIILLFLAVALIVNIAYEIYTRIAVGIVMKAGQNAITTVHTPHPVNLEKNRTRWLPRFLDFVWLADNADEDYDASFKPNKPHWLRKILFLIRNPFHNFTFFYAGVAHRHFVRYSLHPGIWGPGPEGEGVNAAYIQSEGLVVGYPFLSIRKTIGRRNFQAYLGWRERGNFGMALRFQKIKNP